MVTLAKISREVNFALKRCDGILSPFLCYEVTYKPIPFHEVKANTEPWKSLAGTVTKGTGRNSQLEEFNEPR